MKEPKALKKQSPVVLIAVLILAVCLTQFGSAIYSPSLPAIAQAYSVTIDTAQWSMSSYMFGVMVSHLVFGPLSEGLGRKKPLSLGLMIMVLASFVCLFAPTMGVLILGRFVQGIGAGSCTCLWRPVFRDVFGKEDLAKYSSYLISFATLIVPLSPLIGGYLQALFGWYGGFVFMMLYALTALAGICFFFAETHTSYHPSKLRVGHILSQYLHLFKSRLFMGAALSAFLTYGAMFSWFVVGPAFIIKGLGMDSITYGWITFMAAITSFFSAQINARVVKKMGTHFMLRLGWGLCVLGSLLLLIFYYSFGLNVWAIMPGIFLTFFAGPFIWPNILAAAFGPFGHMAGYAGATYGFMQVGGGAIFFAFMAWLPEANQCLYALVVLLSFSLAWAGYEFFVIKDEKRAHKEGSTAE